MKARKTSRQQRHEIAAESAARRVVSGGRVAGGWLTPHPVASMPGWLGAGRPLAAPLRERLEAGFSADLSALRIHTGANAGRWLAELGTDGAAAGNRIALAPSAFHPQDSSGLRLLAHEVAHTLQQASVALPDGRRRVVARSGDALPQGDPESMEAFYALNADEQLDHIRRVHEADHAALHDELETWFPAFRTALLANPDTDSARAWLQRDAETRLPALRESPRQLAVWADVAKLFDDHLGVRAVQTNPWIKTINMGETIRDGLLAEATNAEFWGRSLTTAWPANLYFPAAFSTAIDSFLWSAPPAVGSTGVYAPVERPYQSFTRMPSEDLDAMLAPNLDPRRLKPSEWVLAGMYAILHLEATLGPLFDGVDRRVTARASEDSTRDIQLDRFQRMKWRADDLQRLAERMAGVSDSREVGVYWWAYRALAPVITERATEAQQFWQAAFSRQNERTASIIATGQAGQPGDVVPGYLTVTGFAAEMAPLGTALAGLLPALLQVPRTRDRNERWRNFPTQAEAFRSALDEQVILPAVERAVLAQLGGNTALANAVAWFAAFASSVHSLIQRATPSAIAELASPELLPDEAMFTRWAVAQRIGTLAAQFAPTITTWTAVQQAVASVDRIGTDLQTSDLSLPNPLELDESSEPADLPLDQPSFNDSVAPFTPADFANFFGRVRMAALATAIRARLDARNLDPTADINDLGLMAEAQTVLESPELQAQMPQRYLARNVLWVAFPGEPANRFSDLLDQNWYIRQLDSDPNRVVLMPDGFRQAHGEAPGTIAVWSVPRPLTLIQRLRGIHFFNLVVHLATTQRELFISPDVADPATAELEMTDAARAALADPAAFDQAAVDRLDDWTWWRAFATINGISAPARTAATGIGDELGAAYTAQVRDTIALELEATNSDRGLARREIATLLEDFSGRVGDLHLLTRVLQVLDIFHRLARPSVALAAPGVDTGAWRTQEARLQASALVLELAEPLAEAGVNVGLFSYRHDLFPWLSHAAADADAVAARADILGGSLDERQALTRAGRERLLAAKTAMLARLVEFQTEMAIQGVQSSSSLISQMTPTRPIRAGTPIVDDEGVRDLSGPRGVFRIDGLYIEIVSVLTDFTFFPRFGRAPAPGEADHTYQRASRLVLGLVDSPDQGTPHTPDPAHPLDLVRVRVGLAEDQLQPVTITDHDLDADRSGMSWLSHAVHMAAVGESMESLGRIVDAYGHGLMFVLSLTPMGWAVDVAEMIAMMAQAFSDDPDSVLTQIQDLISEPDEAFRRLIHAVEENLTPEKMLEAFLLGSAHFHALAALMPHRREPRSPSPVVRRGIGGALARVRRIGTAVGTRLQRVQNRVQPPIRALRGGILSRPSLATAVHWAANHWDILTDVDAMEGAIIQHPIAGPIYEIAQLLRERLAAAGAGFSNLAELETTVRGMAGRAREMVESLRNLELPEEIVPLEAMNSILLNAFLHFVSRRAPGKVRILSAIIIGAADLLGARQLLVEELSKQMRGTRFDPNTYWREFVVPELAEPFREAVHGLADGLDYAFAHVPMLGWFAENIERPEVEVGTSTAADADFNSPETTNFETAAATPAASADPATPADPSAATPGAGGASPLRLPGHRVRPAAPGGIALSGGTPLSAPLRQRWEGGFGHDLGHVRLHQGSDAARLTGRLGAAALTSGSRIFLAPGLSPNHGVGEHVLGHELAHVLQKTGPRAPGSDPTPRSGQGGLRQRPHEEAAADRMAALARRGSGRVRIEGAHESGASPTLAAVVPTFLASISDMSKVTESLASITTDAAHAGSTSDLDENVLRTGRAIWDAVNAKITAGALSWPRFVPGAEQPMVLRFLRRRLEPSAPIDAAAGAPGTRHAGAITDAIRVLAMRAQREIPPPAAAAGAAPATPAAARKELVESTFVRELQMYLLGRTGMSLDINHVRVTAPPGRRVVPTVTVGSVEVEDIILRWLPTDSEPWDEVVRRTWPTGDTTTRRQAAARLIRNAVEPPTGVAGGGSAPRVWDSNEFKFRNSFKDDVEVEVNPPALDVARLPDWSDFIDVRQNDKKAAIRLGTHGGFTDGTWNLDANDRQSHHTTQFLVAEYFHNEKDFKPFPTGRNWPNTIAFTGAGAARTVNTISASAGSTDTIQVERTYAPGRGGRMPAILLSSSTHLGGDLHVTPRADETGASSQGYAIHRYFVGHLPNEIKPNIPDPAANQWLSDSTNDAPTKIYRAVQATYHDIRSEMMTKLTRNFPTAELSWYRRVAGTHFATKTHNKTDAQLIADLNAIATSVSTETTGHNDTVMTGLGWDQSRRT